MNIDSKEARKSKYVPYVEHKSSDAPIFIMGSMKGKEANQSIITSTSQIIMLSYGFER